MEFIKEYPSLTILMIFLVGGLAINTKLTFVKLKKQLLSLMLIAEKEAKYEIEVQGKELMDRVISLAFKNIIPRLPIWIRIFINEAILRDLAQKLYNRALKQYYREK